MVLQARNLRLERNEAYLAGVNIFSTFKVFFLGGQERAKEDPAYHEFLKQLRDMKKECPIDADWISKLPPLTKVDVDSEKKWEFATIATTGNVERMNIIKYQASRYGRKKNEPILYWKCPVRKNKSSGKNVYDDLDISQFEHTDQFCLLDKYYIRGAKCVIGENVCTELGIAKGTTGKMVGLVWDKEVNAPIISDLP